MRKDVTCNTHNCVHTVVWMRYNKEISRLKPRGNFCLRVNMVTFKRESSSYEEVTLKRGNLFLFSIFTLLLGVISKTGRLMFQFCHTESFLKFPVTY